MDAFSNFSVLVVEDNEINLELAKLVLKKLGVRASYANNGVEALGLAERSRFDLILMDCQMPELDGYETTLRLRHEYPLAKLTKIVALTGNTLDCDKKRCLEVGMDDFITKPVTLDSLTLKLKAHLREIDQSKELTED